MRAAVVNAGGRRPPHLHCLVLDGVYGSSAGVPVIHEARAPSIDELESGDAITAEVTEKALGFYVKRRAVGKVRKVGEFTAKTRQEADRQLKEMITRTQRNRPFRRPIRASEASA